MTRRRQGSKEHPSDVAGRGSKERPSDVAGRGSKERPSDVAGRGSKERPFTVAGQGSGERYFDIARAFNVARPFDVPGQGSGSEERPLDMEGEVKNLRYLLARASSLVFAMESGIERAPWGDNAHEDRRRMEDLSHLVAAASEALMVAIDNGAELAARLAKLPATRIAAALAKHSTGRE